MYGLPDTVYCILDTKDIGRPSAGAPPLPIPNREVKPCRADGTGVTPGRVGRRPYHYGPPPIRAGGFFLPFFSRDRHRTGRYRGGTETSHARLPDATAAKVPLPVLGSLLFPFFRRMASRNLIAGMIRYGPTVHQSDNLHDIWMFNCKYFARNLSVLPKNFRSIPIIIVADSGFLKNGFTPPLKFCLF